MNKKQQAIQRLETILQEDSRNLVNIAIIREGDVFHAFNTYRISREGRDYRVEKFTSDHGLFGSSRTALSYCIADKLGQLNLSLQIRQLDQEKTQAEADLDVRSALANRTKDAAVRSIAETKLETRRRHLRYITEQLDKCVNLAKYWQIKGFNNETARTGRTASNRTSR